MQTTLTTKDKKQVTIEHRKEIPDHEAEQLRGMTFRRLYHVGNICGFVVDD
jgi:hypothetical protein